MNIKLVVLMFCISMLSPLANAMQTPTEKKLTQDRLYIKRGLTDVLNNSANFFAGTTINELNRMIDLGQIFLKSKDSIDFFKVELNKNDDQVTSAFNSLIQMANERLMQKGEPSRLGNVVQATAKKPQAKQVAKPAVKNIHQVPNSQKKSQKNNNAPIKVAAAKVVVQKPKVVQAPQQAQAVKSNNGNSNNDLAPAQNEIRDPLWKAVLNNNIELVKWHLAQGSDVNKGNPGDDTPLSIAISNGNEEIVDLLLKAGANVNKVNANNHSPLMFAVFRNNLVIAKKLIEAGADVNFRDQQDNTAFIEAADDGSYDMAKLLIDAGADVEAIDKMGLTPRNHALMRGHHNIKKLIDDHLAATKNNLVVKQVVVQKVIENKQQNKSTIALNNQDGFWKAAAAGDLESIKKLIADGMDVNKVYKSGETAIAVAAEGGQEEVVDYLIKAGGDVNKKNASHQTPLSYALIRNHLKVARKLIKAGADINARDNLNMTLLMDAVLNSNVEAIKMLIELGADTQAVDSNGMTARKLAVIYGKLPMVQVIDESLKYNLNKTDSNDLQSYYNGTIWQAAQKNNLVLFKQYLKLGADINGVDEKGRTPLMIAADYGHTQLAAEIVGRGANLNVQDAQGNTALQLAIMRKYNTIASMLLTKKADFKIKNNDGHSVLWLAVRQRNSELIEQLIKFGADLKETDEDGFTLLMLATYMFSFNDNIITQLFKAGIDVNEADDFGVTALMVAASRGYVKAAQELLDAGASLKLEDVTGRTALDYASNDKMRVFLEAELAKRYVHVPIAKPINTELLMAAKKNDLATVQNLINDKVDLEVRNDHDATPLALAARWATVPMVKLLVEAGAVIDSEDDQLKTPFVSAVINGNYEIAKYLLENGAKVNHIESYRGRTPLHYIIRMTEGGTGQEKTVKQMPLTTGIKMLNLLLANGADPNIVDTKKRMTALKFAYALKQMALAKILQKVTSSKTKLSYLNIEDQWRVNSYIPNLNINVAFVM